MIERLMDERIVLPPGAIGYVFRTDSLEHGWAYIGQSTRLDQDHIDAYFGSGYNIQEAIAEQGTRGLIKRLIGHADNQLALHYLEMVSIAKARSIGVPLLNGDFGGPRPFPMMQRALWNVLPEAMAAALHPKAFHKVIAENRVMVEQAILDAISTEVDDFYVGFERDVRALEDLSQDCPACGSPAGDVCRTNSKSPTKPHNPTWNHKARPRRSAQ